MAIDWQVVSFPLAQGLDTKTDVKQLQIGKMSDMGDCVFTTGGELRKRNGNSPIDNSASQVGNAGMVGAFKKELVAANQNTFYSYAQNGPEWVSKDPIESFEITSSPVVRGQFEPDSVSTTQGNTKNPDSAYNITYGFSCHTFVINRLKPAFYYFIDQSTGTIVLNGNITCAASNNGLSTAPMIPVAIGKYILIFYSDTNTTIKYQAFDCTTQTLGAAVSVATDKTSANAWSAVYSSRLNRAYVVWWNGTDIKGKYLDTSLTQTASSSNVTQPLVTRLEIASDSNTTNTLPVAIYAGSDVKTFTWNDNMSSVVMANTLIETIANVVQLTLISYGGYTTFFYTIAAASAADSWNYLTRVVVVQPGTSTIGTPAVYQRSCSISSRPFIVTSIGDVPLTTPQLHICLIYEDTEQSTYFINYSQYPTTTTAPTPTTVGKYAPLLAAPYSGPQPNFSQGPPSQVYPIIAGYKFLVTQIQLNDATNLFNAETCPQYFIFDWGGANSIPQIWNKVEEANSLILSGGIVWMYDGFNVAEQNFNLYPYSGAVAATANNTGGGLVGGGVYQYIFTYEWMDIQGQQNRSFPSSAMTITAAASADISSNHFTAIPTLRVTNIGGVNHTLAVQIAIYRTTAGGTIFYKDGVVQNDTTIDSVSYTSSISDAQLQTHEQLYTQTQLANSAPPASRIITTFKERVVAVPSEENATTLWFSQQIIPGAAVEFSPFLTWPVSTIGGGITAVQQMDDKLIVFKKDAIFYMFGDGPSPLGANNDWTVPTQIPCNVGATSQRGVLLTALGIIFQSQQGFYLLDRSLGVSYIGADVEAYNAVPFFQVTTAKLLSNSTMAKFCLNNGMALVYDCYYKQWSKFTNHGANDSCIFQNLFTFAASAYQASTLTNGVWRETPGTYTDNSGNNSYNLTFVTGWISFSKVQNFQRVRRVMLLGDDISDCTFHIGVQYDYGANSDSGSLVAAPGLLPANFMYYIPQQKTEAIMLTVYENNDTGEGMRFSNLAFELGIKKGFYKTPASQRIG